MNRPRVLVVDDDPGIILSVRRALEARGYEVRALEQGRRAAAEAQRFHPEVVVLDLMLPDLDGLDVARAIRADSDASIIVLSAIGDDQKKVTALDEGADDYLTKPFSMEELLARIRVALRRRRGAPSGARLAVGPLEMDIDARTVAALGRELRLTPTEFELLRILLEHPGKVITQRQALVRVWGAEYIDDTHILRTFIHQLRAKLRAVSPEAAQMIRTDPGVGYRIQPLES